MQGPTNIQTYQDNTLDLKNYVYIIFKRRWLLISSVSIIMVITFINIVKETPIYRATSLVLIEKPSASSTSGGSPKESVTPEVGNRDYYNTQYEILKSRMLSRRAVQALGLASRDDFKGEFPENKFRSLITVEPLKNTRLVNVNVDYKDPVMATTMVNTLVSLYIEQNIENLLFMSKEILKAFPEDAKEVERHTIYGQLKDLDRDEAIESLPSIANNQLIQKLKSDRISIEVELANLSKRYKARHPKITALNTKLLYLNDKIKIEMDRVLGSLRADLAGRLQANNIRVIDYAQVPKSPIRPQKMRSALFGFAFSLFLGIVLIFLMEYLDDSVKNEDDVKNSLALPYLGSFPEAKEHASVSFAERLSHLDKNPRVSEALRNIRTNIIFSSPKKELKKILITSAVPKEGKSLLASYVAFSLAKAGSKTLLLDGDIRRPSVHKNLGVGRSPGLVDLLVEGTLINDAVRKTNYDNFYILTSGAKTPNPQELLGSDSFESILNELSQTFEKIIIDTPPSFNISDALILSKACDAVIFVTKCGVVSERAMYKLKEKFISFGSKILGVIINFSSAEKSSYYNYRYHHKYYKNYYASEEDELVGAGKETF